jgi:hypothetical protein
LEELGLLGILAAAAAAFIAIGLVWQVSAQASRESPP